MFTFALTLGLTILSSILIIVGIYSTLGTILQLVLDMHTKKDTVRFDLKSSLYTVVIGVVLLIIASV